MHTGQFPNGTAFVNNSAAAVPQSPTGSSWGGTYSPNSANGLSSKFRRAMTSIRRAKPRPKAHAAFASTAASPSASASAGAAPANSIKVNAYLHVVTTVAHAGMVTQQQMQQQLAAMNAAYSPSHVSFALKNVSFTTNDAWAVGGSDSLDLAMKSALRQGTYADLNLYFQSDMAGGVLGQCTLPTDVGASPAPAVYVRDGCNIALGTVPGGPINGYNMGKTAVHETGHWLGLLHTFEGYSCAGNGDFVADTPAESQSTDGCPTNPWKNTCGNRTGMDPIHNYMDYSTDACYERFTNGQVQRVMGLWPQYRQGK